MNFTGHYLSPGIVYLLADFYNINVRTTIINQLTAVICTTSVKTNMSHYHFLPMVLVLHQ